LKGKALHIPLGGWAEITGRFFSALDVLEVEIRSNSPLKRLVKDSSGKLRGALLNRGVKVEADAIILAVPFVSVEAILETSRMQVPTYENNPLKAIVWDLQLSMKAFEGVHAIWDSDRKVALIMMSNIVPERLPEDCREKHSHLSFLSYNDKQSIESFLDERLQGWRKNIVDERCLEDVVISQSTAEEKEFEQPYLQQGLAFAGDWINGEGWLSERAFKSGIAAVQALHESL
jgi:predicted NAD/FAD-dependent oxidoreductase